MKGTSIRTALVSTNSICQGEQVANLWEPLMEDGLHIDFAHRSFVWSSESSQKAQVHCVIVGVSFKDVRPRFIYDAERKIIANNINVYLIDDRRIFGL